MTQDWDDILTNASIAALQGIQESGEIGLVADVLPEVLVDRAVAIGRALVERLKKEITN